MFGRNPRDKAVLEIALKQVEKLLRGMQKDGKDLAQLKYRKFQKTHFTTCACPKCMEAKREKNPHLRGILEDGVKVYIGEGDGSE